MPYRGGVALWLSLEWQTGPERGRHLWNTTQTGKPGTVKQYRLRERRLSRTQGARLVCEHPEHEGRPVDRPQVGFDTGARTSINA